MQAILRASKSRLSALRSEFTWDTSGVPYPHNYALTAKATIAADNNPSDNTLARGTIEVRIPNDVSGDGKVDIYDAIQLTNYFGQHQGDKGWDPDADLNHDCTVDIFDMIIVARNLARAATLASHNPFFLSASTYTVSISSSPENG